ncbi:MAG: CRISPR-associated endonuclease Cas2 [Planctomycetaceae bacterium]|nr:CRISPR-associated endonuclease Cas2 [Planctomycetaceae bacterium]
MYLLVMFDLPTKEKRDRRIYRRFRKRLLSLGFTKIQFSVYLKFAESDAYSESIKRKIRKVLPRFGNIRIISLPPKTFDKMEIYNNHEKIENESPRPNFIVF